MEALRVVDWVLLSATAAGAAAVAALSWRTARLARALRIGQHTGGEELVRTLEQLRKELARLQAEQAHLSAQVSRCVQRVGMVRYDAFPGSGGKLSFSVALLDARGDGLVLSVLHGRDGSYAYAKAIRGGQPSHPLSEEEQQAIAQATGR